MGDRGWLNIKNSFHFWVATLYVNLLSSLKRFISLTLLTTQWHEHKYYPHITGIVSGLEGPGELSIAPTSYILEVGIDCGRPWFFQETRNSLEIFSIKAEQRGEANGDTMTKIDDINLKIGKRWKNRNSRWVLWPPIPNSRFISNGPKVLCKRVFME